MARDSLSRWLLVNYAGYPFAPNSLMPDNGLANLAGALLARQKPVRILDYCTAGTMARLTSDDLTARLSHAWNRIRSAGRGPLARLSRLPVLVSLRQCERARDRLQARVVADIGRELAERVRAEQIEAVGFKLWNGDGLAGSAAMARTLRAQCPGVRVFGGGPMVDFFMERILAQFDGFDALGYGEGEETIQHLAESGADPRAYAGIPNLLYRENGHIRRSPEQMVARLDELPMPAYDPAVYPAMAGNQKIRIIVIDDSRGCRNQCAFCVHPVKSHRRLREKSIPRLMKEVDALTQQLGCRTLRFAGSCTPYPLLNAFAAEIVRTGRTITYTSFAHIRDSDTADFPLLRRSGCVALFFGIESANQPILDRMRKGIAASRIPETIRRTREAGIFPVGSLIFPAPGETAESEAQTLALLGQGLFGSVTLQAPIVAPRTDWFDHPERYGIGFRSPEEYLDATMRWKAKILLPTAFWKPLPVWIDGRSYKGVLQRTGAFARRVTALGVPTSVSDETYLMSLKAGLGVVEFRDAVLGAFFAGDTHTVDALVHRINAAA